jgi:hypothetical protein
MKARLMLTAALLAALLALLSGCGGDSSSPNMAELVPQGSVVYAEGQLQPSGELQSNADALAEKIAGVDNLGDFVVSKLEESARDDGEPFDFAKEVEPWLGERGAVAFQRLEDGDLSSPLIIVQSTDLDATQEFVDAQAEGSAEPYEHVVYEGVDYRYRRENATAIGVIGDFLVVTKGSFTMESAINSLSKDASLADEDRFEEAMAAASEDSLADVYADVGALIDQSSGEGISDQAQQLLRNAGIDPSDATAVASIVPGSDRIEVDLSSDLAGERPPRGDASDLLASLPGKAFAGIAISGFGGQLKDAIDTLDKEGISGTVPPNQLKKGLMEAGVDLEGLASSLRDGAIFAVGSDESSLGGALVLSTEGSQATEAIASLGLLLRRGRVEGVTALSGKYSGFSVRSDELGPKPLVVAAKKGRIAIGYGLPATIQGLTSGSGETLSDNPAYEDAVASLGDAPISGFADGPAALGLADALIPSSDDDFEAAKQYLKSISFLALGPGEEEDGLATAKLIVGLKE